MNIQIRKADIQDLEQIEGIENSLERRILSSTTLYSTLNKANYYYLVATIKDTIVGYIAAELLVDHFDILSIAVSEDYRRQNIASLLLKEFFSNCLNLNIQDIFLEVRISNIAAIRFYEKMGFEKISTRKKYYKDTNEDAYIYKKIV